LKCVATEHEEAKANPSENFFALNVPENGWTPKGHDDSREREAQGKKKKNGSVVEGTLYYDKS